MRLICLAPHVYQDAHFDPGLVYDFDDGVALRLLQDYGPKDDTRPNGSDATRRGLAPRFDVAPPEEAGWVTETAPRESAEEYAQMVERDV